METNILILGKGDNAITMVLDNLFSNGISGEISIFNNLKLPVLNYFEHPHFKINLWESVEMNVYEKYCLGAAKASFKRKIIETLKPDLNKFINVIHKGLDISATSTLGIGCMINSKVSIAAHSHIHNFVFINRHVSIGHHTTIGDYVSINPGCNIAGHVYIGESTTLGIGTTVIDGITIGKNSIIGAGSVVTKNVPDNVIAYGNPCKYVRDNN